MPTGNTTLLGLALPVEGELSGEWGDVVNNSITSLVDSAVAGTTTLSTDANVALTTTALVANQARQAILLCTGARTALRTITAPAQSKSYIVVNATTGGFGVQVVGVGPTTGVTIASNEKALIAWNGSDFVKIASSVADGVTSVSGTGTVNGITLTGTVTSTGNLTLGGTLANVNLASQVTGTLPVLNGGTGSTTSTGTGAVVRAENPTLVGTPAAPTAVLGTNTTQIATTAFVKAEIGATSVNSFSAGTTGFTPSTASTGAVTLSGTLAASNGGTGITSLGAGVATFLGTPSSANLAAALTDETGTGSAVFATSPTLVTPALGTPASGVLTNATGLPISTGVSGLGTGVATFLATPSSANLRTAVTDETGTGALVFGTSPAITTSLTTPSTSFALANTTATTLNVGGAATTLSIGAATGTMTVNNTTLAAKAITASTTLGVTGAGTIQGLTVGLGGGAVADNTAVGVTALNANTTGTFNTAIGASALAVANADNNTAIGTSALSSATTGANNTAVGAVALSSLITGNQNTAIGDGALTNLNGYAANVAVGKSAMSSAQCSDGVGIGYASLSQSTVDGLVAIGATALFANTSGSENTAVGYSGLSSNVTGISNTAVGYNALTLSTGDYNTAVGRRAADANVGGSAITAVGSDAAGANTSGGNNTAIGASALLGNTTGSNHTAVGSSALGAGVSGSNNTAIGTSAGYGSYGDNNTYVGYNSGFGMTTGSNNVIIGSYQGSAFPITATGSNWIVLSDGAGSVRQAIDSAGNAQFLTGAVVVYAPAPASISAAATLSNANLQAQIINTTGTSYTVTMPTGSTMDTLISWATNNIGFDFSVINTASGTITMAVNTGVTSLGALTIATGTSAQFRIRRTALSTYIMYRIG